jgi:hypothetical protein
VNFNQVYQQTFFNTPSYGLARIDYETLPVHFEGYTPDDQIKIRARLETICKALKPSV